VLPPKSSVHTWITPNTSTTSMGFRNNAAAKLIFFPECTT